MAVQDAYAELQTNGKQLKVGRTNQNANHSI